MLSVRSTGGVLAGVMSCNVIFDEGGPAPTGLGISGEEKTHRTRDRQEYAEDQVEMGAMCLQTKEHQGFPATPEAKRKAQEGACPGAFAGSLALLTLSFRDSQPSEPRADISGPWHHVRAALEKDAPSRPRLCLPQNICLFFPMANKMCLFPSSYTGNRCPHQLLSL